MNLAGGVTPEVNGRPVLAANRLRRLTLAERRYAAGDRGALLTFERVARIYLDGGAR